MTTERFTVHSKDGVPISVQKTGSGPSLLLIHGALLNGSLSWGAVLPSLAEHYTVYVMDRRGRAPSGDGDPAQYSIAREADDIAAVAQSIGGPVTVLGHSYGALSTLYALDQLKNVSKLLLYEPPVVQQAFVHPAVARMESALAEGNREQIVITFLRDQIGSPPERLEAMRNSPIWPIVLDISPTLPRESRNVNAAGLPKELLTNCKIPATMLLGSETQGMLREAAYFVNDTIPGCEMAILEGQGHGAMMEAPDYFAAKVLDLITVPSRSSSHTAS